MSTTPDKISDLDQSKLNDHKLDPSEIAYLKNKKELFVNDIGDLQDDIVEANKAIFAKDEKCRYLLDSFVSDPKLLTDQLHSPQSQAVLTGELNKTKDPFEKRIIIVKMLFSKLP